jgi:gamma-glutamyl AIG2-like cyclotransferase
MSPHPVPYHCDPMTLHFAYGSNMSRPHMRARCPDASAIGTMTLSGWRFVIGPDGFASLVRQPGSRVHGVLWRLSTRDVAAINAYENVQSGLYLRRRLPVRLELRHARPCAGHPRLSSRDGKDVDGRDKPGHDDESGSTQWKYALKFPATALVYIARRQGTGTPRPGYIDQVVEAARDWKLPQPYIRSLARWAPSRWRGARARDTGEVG